MRYLSVFGLLSGLVLSTAHADSEGMVMATNATGTDVLRALVQQRPTKNTIVSPYSIESVLVLAYAGADGDTRSEMARVLHLPPETPDAALAFDLGIVRSRLERMAARIETLVHQRGRVTPSSTVENGRPPEAETPPMVVWREANRIFADERFSFRSEFLGLMRGSFYAPLQPVDFLHSADQARAKINGWVAEQTEHKILDLIPPGGVGADTRAVLVNALYLNVGWETPFLPKMTRPKPFRLSKDTIVSVPTMTREGRLPYEQAGGLTAVALGYVGQDLQFLILLPDEGRSPADVLCGITAADLAHWANLAPGPSNKVTLYLPKFRHEAGTISLGETLRGLGLRHAFDLPTGTADFSRMAPRTADSYLKISEVFHQTLVSVDEHGTEAAAATAVKFNLFAAYYPSDPIEIRVDRPFLFAIQQRSTGLLLFLGQMMDPR